MAQFVESGSLSHPHGLCVNLSRFNSNGVKNSDLVCRLYGSLTAGDAGGPLVHLGKYAGISVCAAALVISLGALDSFSASVIPAAIASFAHPSGPGLRAL